jgi:hypothetical protein
MNWGKFMLVFQAILTLVIGIIFLAQSLSVASQHVSETFATYGNPDNASLAYFDLSSRFKLGGYIVLVVSLIELIILQRL